MTKEQPPNKRSRDNSWKESPVKNLLMLILTIMLAEALIMLFINAKATAFSPGTQILIDVFLLLFVLLPLFYLLALKPLLLEISIRQRAEAALDISKERSHILIESLRDLTWELDADLRFTYVGSFLSNLIGYNSEEIIGHTPGDFFAKTSQQILRSNLAATFAVQRESGASALNRIEAYELLAKDGTSIWVEVTATVIFNNRNELVRIIGVTKDITERKQAENALELSYSLIEAAFDSTADGLLVVDKNGKIAQFNQKFLTLWQIPAEIIATRDDGQVLSFVLDQLQSPEQFLSRVRELYKNADSVSLDELEFKDGRIFERYSQPQKIRDENVGRVWSFRDITEHKRSELSLQQANLLLLKTISSLNEAVFIVDTDSRRIQEVNICAERMFGYNRDELLGSETSILHLNEQMHQRFGEEMLSAYLEKGFFQKNYRMKRKDGTVFPSEHYVSPIIAEDSSYQCHVCVVRDISERNEVEESLTKAFSDLAERKSFIETIINSMESGIIVTDLGLQVTMANAYVESICKQPIEKIIGASLQELFPEIASELAANVSSNEIVVHCGDTDVTIGFNSVDLRNFAEEKTGYIINFRDVTEIVRFRSINRRKERLSAMGEVVARVAHEMRNPLFAMTSVGQILEMELELTPPQRQLMDSFMKEARRLNNLVADLLDGTRELRLRKKITNISQVIDASIHVCRLYLQEKNIELVLKHPDQDLQLLADPEKIEQVLVNLIQNAIQASESGGKIELVQSADDNNLSVMLVDAGRGIPEKIMGSIFEVFFTTKRNGTGMGLSISKNIVEAHDGTLVAENMTGKGAKFTLTLPLQANSP